MSQKISLGRVIEISNNNISVSISEEFDKGYVFIDGEQIKIGGVSNLILVNEQVYEIVQEKTGLTGGEAEGPRAQRTLHANLLGYFKNFRFYLGSNGENPSVFDNVYNLTEEEFDIYYFGSSSKNAIQIGRHLFHHTRFNINIDDFFASHTLICGNTGSGKSNTINRIFTELFSKYDVTGSCFLFIDTNAEYKKAFTETKKILTLDTRFKKNNTFTLPINLLEPEDWKILLEATEKTQFPLIKKVIGGLKRNVFCNAKKPYDYILDKLCETFDAILGSNNGSSVKLNGLKGLLGDIEMESSPYSDWLVLNSVAFDYTLSYQNIVQKNTGNKTVDQTDELLDRLKSTVASFPRTKTTLNCEDLLLLMRLDHYSRVYKWNTNENNTSPMIARFVSHLYELETLISEYDGTDTHKSLREIIFEDNNIVLCDVKNARKDIKRVMVAFLCKKLYQLFQKNDCKESLHIIIDEAHNYLSDLNLTNEDAISNDAIETFETIIKEGRKFGVFLCMSTQRPNEITQTLLSQAHNYIVHKLVNPNDIAVIQKAVPFLDARSLESMSILAPGQAIFSGTAFNRPSIVVVDYDKKYSTEVESDTIKLTKYWKRKP